MCKENTYQTTEKDVFAEVIDVMRESFVATFTRENDTGLLMRFVNGQKFRLSIESVK